MPFPSLQAAERRLVVAIDSDPATLDPYLAGDAYGVRISHQLLHETLVRIDDDLNTVPGLARWEQVSPILTRFQLSEGVRFHGGQPLRAADAVATLQRFMAADTASPYGGVLRDHIASIRSTGKLEFEITLKAPFPGLLEALILPVVGPGAQGEKGINGTGPYTLKSRAPNELVLERFANHANRPKIAQVAFKVIKDDNTRLLKFRKGDVHLGINVIPLEKLRLFTRNPLKNKYTLEESPGLSFQYLGFNFKDSILAKQEVRLALAQAIDVEALIKHRQRGHSVRATGLVPPGSPYTDASLKSWPYAPAEARRLLDKAGYPAKDGTRFKLVYKTTTNRAARAQAAIIAADLKKVGIEVEVRSYEWATFYADIIKGNFQIYSLRWIGVANPGFLYELLHSTKTPPDGRNRGYYADVAMDGLLEAALDEPNTARRQQAYRRVHRRAHETLPYVSLWHNNNVAAISTELGGFRMHPSGGFEYLSALHWLRP